MKAVFITALIVLAAVGCGSSSTSSNGGGNSSGEVDRSSLPTIPPAFSVSPMQFPNGISTDLHSFGVFNLTNECDIVHYGWDFAPAWNSYSEDKVPIVAVADGIVTNIIYHSTNTYQGQEHNTWIVFLAVAKEVDAQYTFEPFITFDSETYPLQWLNVSKGDTVHSGDIIGYLPKVGGNLGETLIHIDWKIGTGTNQSDYACPTGYFSADWQDANISLLEGKIQSLCSQVCYE